MVLKKILNIVIGLTQEVIGLLGIILTVLLFLHIVDVEAVFSLPSEFLPFYLTVLVLFSVFSVVNGLFLIREGRSA